MGYNPERALWREVLLRQIDDALYGPAGITGRDKRIAEINAARNLLSKPSPQLDHICALADIDPSAVVTRIGARIAKAPTPAELAADKKAGRHVTNKRPKPTKAKRIKNEDRLITFKGETLTMQQWSKRTGLSVKQIASRLCDGWSAERAIAQPIGKRNRNWGMTGAASVADHTDSAGGVAGGPGVVSDFRKIEGTGGGTSAQDRSNLDFSPSEKVKA